MYGFYSEKEGREASLRLLLSMGDIYKCISYRCCPIFEHGRAIATYMLPPPPLCSTMICAPCRIIPPPVPRRRSIVSSRPRGAGGYFAFGRPACHAFSSRSMQRHAAALGAQGSGSGYSCARDGRAPRRIARMGRGSIPCA